MTRPVVPSLLALLAASAALPAAAEEVNVYSLRQPDLVQPLFDVFTAETGITVNVAHVDKGLVERLQAEGDRSPADVILTVDIARLSQVVDAGVTQPVTSDVLAANIPAAFRDPANQWFGLTTRRARHLCFERADQGRRCDDLRGSGRPKWKGRICTRPARMTITSR